jgi:cyclase
LHVRIIPRLDIKGPNLVKGIHFEGLRVLGKPEQFAKFYYDNGADELFYQDVVASLYGRNSLLDIIKKTSREIFIPLCVGGGLRSIDDIRSVLRAGADKVAINTAAIGDPALIKSAAKAFGSSTILASIEAIKRTDGTYEACTDYGRELTEIDAIEWAKRAVDLGAGELLVTSIDKEGTGKGYDLELTKKIAEEVPVPVIACGGCGKLEHVSEVINVGKADAASMASILHYYLVENSKLINKVESFREEGNIIFLSTGDNFSKVKISTVQEIKRELIDNGISCRVEDSQ